MHTSEFMTTAQVADALHVGVRAVARLVERRALEPAIKLPGVRGAYLFDPEAVREFAATRAA